MGKRNRRSSTPRKSTQLSDFLKQHIVGIAIVALVTGLAGNFLYDQLKQRAHVTRSHSESRTSPNAFHALVMNKTDASFHIDIFTEGTWWHDQHLPAGVQVVVASPQPHVGIRMCRKEKGYPWPNDIWAIAAWPKGRSLVPDYEFYYGTVDRIFLRTGANPEGQVVSRQNAVPDASPPTTGFRRLPFEAHTPH